MSRWTYKFAILLGRKATFFADLARFFDNIPVQFFNNSCIKWPKAGKLNQQPQNFFCNIMLSRIYFGSGLLVIPILLDKLNCVRPKSIYNQL